MFTKIVNSRLNHMSIKHKLIAIIMCVCVTSVLMVTSIFTASGIYNIKESLKERLQLFASLAGDENAAAILFHDLDIIKIKKEVFNTEKSIIQSCLYDDSGKVIFSYFPEDGYTHKCPSEISSGFIQDNNFISLLHRIEKKGDLVGYIYIKSDLTAVNSYIEKQIFTALTVIIAVFLISYMLAMKLQQLIYRPIINLMDDTKNIELDDDNSYKARKLYNDELGEIAETFNKILEKRNRKFNEFYDKFINIKQASSHSEVALKYIDKEFSNPLKATNSFKTMLKDQVFGPISPMYIEYFDDVCQADYELYGIIKKIMEMFRIQSEIFNNDKKNISLTSIIKRAYNKNNPDNNIELIINIAENNRINSYTGAMELLINNIMTVFMQNIREDDDYTINFSCNTVNSYLHLHAILSRQNDKPPHANDNIVRMDIKEFLSHSLNKEDIFNNKELLIIDCTNMEIRSKLHSINFLSSVNDGNVYISISENILELEVCFKTKELAETYPLERELGTVKI